MSSVRRQLVLALNSTIFKVFYTTGFSTGVKIVSTIILSKVVAVKLGASGLAYVGQLTSFVSIALVLSTGGFTNGIIKYVARLRNTPQYAAFVYSTAKLTLGIASVVGLLLFLCARWLSYVCFKDHSFSYVFQLLGATIVLYSISNFITAVLNGISDYKTYNWLNISNGISSVAVSLVLIYYYGLAGAFVAVALNQTVSCIISIVLGRHAFRGLRRPAYTGKSWSWLRQLSGYSLMAIVTVMLVPATQVYIRNDLMLTTGVKHAGHWEAVSRISNLYLSLLLNVMLVYYLPRLSSLEAKPALRAEIARGLKFFLPVVLICASAVFFARDFIVHVFLSPEFLEINPYFLPQLLGDVFKVISYLFAYLVIARGLVVYFIITEVASCIMYAGLSTLLTATIGEYGVFYAYAGTYLLYLIVQYLFIGKIYLSETSDSRSWIWKSGRI